MTPREELLAHRQIGRAGAELLYKSVLVMAVSHGFPPPIGSATWDKEAVTETAHDFLQGERGAKRLLEVALRSTDDASFARLLDAAVLNYLRDLARSTDMGRLIVRIKEILRDEEKFEVVPGSPERWTMAGGTRTAGTVNPSAWVAATAGVEVEVPKWTSSHRNAPLADRASFVRLMTSVLSVAAGSLTAVDLAHALTTRLDHRKTANTMDMDIQEQVSEPGWLDGDPAVRTEAQLRAIEIFNSLSDRERIIMAHPESSVRDLAGLINAGKSQAAQIRQRLLDRLSAELADDDQPGATATVLCTLCERWIEDRTGREGATSDDK